MNRAHSADQAIRSVEDAKNAGFDNFSLDLIYGSPGLTDEKWGKNLHKAISLEPMHISCYALTVEPRTALYKMILSKESQDVNPEKQAGQFLTAILELESPDLNTMKFQVLPNRVKEAGITVLTGSQKNTSVWDPRPIHSTDPADSGISQIMPSI
jgi:hypothetical protein